MNKDKDKYIDLIHEIKSRLNKLEELFNEVDK